MLTTLVPVATNPTPYTEFSRPVRDIGTVHKQNNMKETKRGDDAKMNE